MGRAPGPPCSLHLSTTPTTRLCPDAGDAPLVPTGCRLDGCLPLAPWASVASLLFPQDPQRAVVAAAAAAPASTSRAIDAAGSPPALCGCAHLLPLPDDCLRRTCDAVGAARFLPPAPRRVSAAAGGGDRRGRPAAVTSGWARPIPTMGIVDGCGRFLRRCRHPHALTAHRPRGVQHESALRL